MPYTVIWSKEARGEFLALRAFDRPVIRRAVDLLQDQAEVETTNRKRLQAPLDLLPRATWEVRVGTFRIFYCIADGTVIVLRVILKTGTTAESL